MQKLTPKQQKFVLCYNGNAKEAAIQAGFSKNGARQTAYTLLTKEHVKEAIRKRTEKESIGIVANRQDRQKFWTDLMNDKAADANARLKASELLGRSEGDFTEKIQHSGGVTVSMGRIKKGGKILAFKVGAPRSS